VSRFGYGFHKDPYAFRLDFRSGYSVNAHAFAAEIRGDVRRENSATHFLFRGPALQGDIRRFELGAEAAVSFDSRDTVAAPSRGTHVTVGGGLYPAVWDVTSTFGEVHGEAATYLTAPLPLQPTLALRAGGKRVWGTHPFQEGAFIGGGSTVRGLYTGRFLGDASAYGNAGLRLRLTSFDILAPGEMGVFGLSDVGRVWQIGESSNKWHTAFGGGLWFAYLNRRNTVSAAVAHGDGRTAVYLRTGFMF
jgi:outer membrane protein assembly factor BamA